MANTSTTILSIPNPKTACHDVASKVGGAMKVFSDFPHHLLSRLERQQQRKSFSQLLLVLVVFVLFRSLRFRFRHSLCCMSDLEV
jgi:hypothetical protein